MRRRHAEASKQYLKTQAQRGVSHHHSFLAMRLLHAAAAAAASYETTPPQFFLGCSSQGPRLLFLVHALLQSRAPGKIDYHRRFCVLPANDQSCNTYPAVWYTWSLDVFNLRKVAVVRKSQAHRRPPPTAQPVKRKAGEVTGGMKRKKEKSIRAASPTQKC